MTKAELKQIIAPVTNPIDLKTLRAIINGKLSRRTITPEQQAVMRAAKDAKKNTAS